MIKKRLTPEETGKCKKYLENFFKDGISVEDFMNTLPGNRPGDKIKPVKPKKELPALPL